MLRKVVLVGGLAIMFAVGLAIAGTPFGGDDTGFVPPNKDIAKCENSVGKAAGKLAKCILGCHKKRAKGSITTEADEDNCESNLPASADCKSKYDTTTGTLTTCPTCLNATGRDTVRDLVEFLIDQNNNKIYCEGTTPWGGDDTGNLPDTKDATKCETGAGGVVAKAIACIIKCHKGRASGKYADDTTEDVCETGCKSKYDTKMGKLDCSTVPCLDTSGERDALFAFVEGNVDGSAGLVYCASPSGAFLN